MGIVPLYLAPILFKLSYLLELQFLVMAVEKESHSAAQASLVLSM